MTDTTPSDSALAPFRWPAFRALWTTALIANVCLWMNDIAAVWTMTGLTSVPVWVAMVQTAGMMPFFLFGLPGGALADIVNKKRYLLFTQAWVAVVSVVLSAVIFLGQMSPVLLLVLTFANGMGTAMRMPVLSSLWAEIVPRPLLPAALGLNGVTMNASRILGPLVAGAVIASAGSAWIFLLNAVMSLVAIGLLCFWKSEPPAHAHGRERWGTALRVGWQFMRHSRHLQGLMLRGALFFFHTSALTSMLALLVRRIEGSGAGTFTVLVASQGAGAIASLLVARRLRNRYARDALVLRAAIAVALAMTAMAFNHSIWLAVPLMALCGSAWLTALNSLSLSAQTGLPDWVRARGMAAYQMALMGSSAAGAFVWGQLATWTHLQLALVLAAGACIASLSLAMRLRPDAGAPSLGGTPRTIEPPRTIDPLAQGKIRLTIEYRIDPARADEFRRVMFEESRPAYLRNGALSWQLLHDLNQPDQFQEVVIDESWGDHVRRMARLTAGEADLRDRKLAFHVSHEPPRVSRHLVETPADAAIRA